MGKEKILTDSCNGWRVFFRVRRKVMKMYIFCPTFPAVTPPVTESGVESLGGYWKGSFLSISYIQSFDYINFRYSNTITGIFNGHTHYDEMVLYHSKINQSKAISVAWNGGSLTTYENLNLNYRFYDVHPENYVCNKIICFKLIKFVNLLINML